MSPYVSQDGRRTLVNHTHIPTAARRFSGVFVCALLTLALLAACSYSELLPTTGQASSSSASATSVHVNALSDVPDYLGEDYIELNSGIPSFTDAEMSVEDGTEIYGELDYLGRATSAFAQVCGRTAPAAGSQRDLNMPDPTGFVQVTTYPGINHLYDRTHLIAYSLTDEATEARDLITGTMHMNQDVMTKFEKKIRDQIAANDMATYEENHVLMRVTPDFRGEELVARGVQIEALSLEENGESICLNVYCYNIQPGVVIDYATGESRLESDPETSPIVDETELEYLLNTSTKCFHNPDCTGGNSAKPENKQTITAKRSDLIADGYKPCGSCNP